MRIWVFSLFLALLFACSNNTKLHKVCYHECYGFAKKTVPSTEGVGECKAGVPICDEDANMIACEGEILPQEEVCDGLDNDCDGSVDERHSMNFPLQPQPGDIDYPCFQLGECRKHTVGCIDGGWQCTYYGSVEAGEETRCDGLDNDCDGLIDEDIYAGDFCYTGPVGTEYNLPCHPGTMMCLNGDTRCINQTLPTAEICDRIDNDCNGLMDDTGAGNPQNYDIVIALDNSGSMCNEIDAVTFALTQYISQFSGNNYVRFAIVSMTVGQTNGYVQVIRNFSDIASIVAELQVTFCGGSYTEASYDAIYEVCGGLLSWRADSIRIYLGFTDETGQSYYDPRSTPYNIINKCTDNGVIVYHWSSVPSDFEPICTATGGRHYPISSDPQTILNDLNEVVSENMCEDP
jgi:hypothetical protein